MSTKQRTVFISPALTAFLGVEIRNAGGVQPATLSSAQESFDQAPDETLILDWCGYRSIPAVNPDKYAAIRKHLRIELQLLVHRYGGNARLEDLINV